MSKDKPNKFDIKLAEIRALEVIEAIEVIEDPKQAAGNKKISLQLIPPAANESCAIALRTGADKYGEWNWRYSESIEVMTYLGAIRRHLDAFLEGEDIDPESNTSHLGHIMAGCAILLDAEKHNKIEDNRPGNKKIK